MSDVRCDVALYSTAGPMLRDSLSFVNEFEAPFHASTLVTRAAAGIESVCLVPLSDPHPASGYGVRVTPSPRMLPL